MAATKRTPRTSKTTPAVIDNTPALDAEIAADAANETASPDVLARITTTALAMKQAAAEAERLTAAAAEQTKEARRLAELVLPQLMDEAGITDLGLDDDTRIERGEEFYASIAKANEAAASKWLEKNGYGAIIKFQVVVPIDKGDEKTRKRVLDGLNKAKIFFEERVSIHANTLRAFVKESLTMTPPRKLPDAITFHVQPVVTLKAVKKPKRKTALV